MINELNRDRELIKQKKQQIFKDILEKIYQKIKQANKVNNYCYYVIPKFVIGKPLFNIANCSEYIYNELVKKGFKITRIQYNYFLIYWGHSVDSDEIQPFNSFTENDNYLSDDFINV